MTLFDLEKVEPAAPAPKAGRRHKAKLHDLSRAMADTKTSQKEILGLPGQRLAKVVPPIEAAQTLHLISAGAWNLHDIVGHAAKYTGPGASLTGYTWSFTPRAANYLIAMLKAKTLASLTMLIDPTMISSNAGAMAQAKASGADIIVLPIHAKGFILSTGRRRVACTSSANFTSNPRIEHAVISTDPDIYAFHASWIRDVVDNKAAFWGARD